MVITLWDPPRECTMRHLGTVVRGTGTFAVRPSPGGSRFTWSEDVVPPLGWLGRAGWPLVRPVFELLMRISLRRLVHDLTRDTDPAAGRTDGPPADRPNGPTGDRPLGAAGDRPDGATGDRPDGATGDRPDGATGRIDGACGGAR